MSRFKIGFVALVLGLLLPSCTTVSLADILTFGTLRTVISPTVTHDPSAPIPDEAFRRYDNILMARSADGFPQLGDPDAPVQVVAFLSFECIHCVNFSHDVFLPLVERIRAGEVFFTYVPMWGLGSIPHGHEAATAAMCAAEQGDFWRYQEALYSWALTFGDKAYNASRLRAGVANLGLDLDQWDACISNPDSQNTLDAAYEQFTQKGLHGTPTVFINNVELTTRTLDAMNAAVDEALPRT